MAFANPDKLGRLGTLHCLPNTVFKIHSLVCSFMVNVSPFITDIFPEQLATDQIADQRQGV